MITEEELPCQRQDRFEGESVPDGFSVSIEKKQPYIPEGQDRDYYRHRFHVILQHTLPDGTVVRFRIAVPKEGITDPSEWKVTRQVKSLTMPMRNFDG